MKRASTMLRLFAVLVLALGLVGLTAAPPERKKRLPSKSPPSAIDSEVTRSGPVLPRTQ